MRTVFLYCIVLLLTSCTRQQDSNRHADHNAVAAQKFTCPMHPQVVQDKAGNCPICGMALVEVSSAKGVNVMLSDAQVRLANVSTRRAGKSDVGDAIELNGTLVVDEQRSENVSARASGRIEKLFIKETGRSVKKGEPLYELYSEDLLTLQQEYLLAKDQYNAIPEKRYKQFADAAEQKLLLYGLTTKQVANLSNQTILPRITFMSPSSGVVTAINVSEGQYVDEGMLLYNVEDLSTLWVEAELYANEIPLANRGDKIKILVAGSEDKPVDATIEFVSPEFRGNAQVLLMRASVNNPDQKFKPGQQAQVLFLNSSRKAIALPMDAVIRDEKGAHVYVQSGKNTFQPRMVKTGMEGFDSVEITEGLSENDTVAISGAYLLYSEIILKKGTHPLAEHKH